MVDKNIKYALVLGGGGANGSYHIGVWRALKELDINIQAVFGNSVGALNGVLFLQDDYEYALSLWQTITLPDVVSLPGEIVSNGKLNLDGFSLSALSEFQKKILKNKGLDTSPLKELVKTKIIEERARKSGLDFGCVTYNIDDFETAEVFIDEIPFGKLGQYVLASASLPGFRFMEIDGKKYVDGGVSNNVPFSMAKRRGYKNIIVIDISGLGVNRRPEINGTNTIYIKNSIELGNVLDFDREKATKFIQLGYYDTLKVFGKLDGIKYFYKYDNNIINELDKILFSQECFNEYSKYLVKDLDFERIKVKKAINKILPKDVKNFMYIIIALMESAALSFDIERNRLYDFKELLELIWSKYNELEAMVEKKSEGKEGNFFESLSQNIRKVSKGVKDNINLFGGDFLDFFNKASYEYEKYLEIIFGRRSKELHTKALSNFFPNLLAAKIFIAVLKVYFR